ncbi:amidohydrolase family protein [Streptomyces parvulus]
MTPPPLSRRNVLAGAASLGGAAAFAATTAHASSGPASRGRGAAVFRDVRVPGRSGTVDLTVRDGRVSDGPAPRGAEVVDGGGRLVLPALVDAHIHPDKTSWGGAWVSREPASGIAEYCEQDVELYHSQRRPVGERAYGLMAHAVTRGTRAMRAHADVAPAYGLAGVEGVAEARERLKGALDVQIVAFPQHGVVRTPGTAELLATAAREGLVDLIGGIDPISFDQAPEEQLDLVFDLADRHGVGVDIHLHDRDEKGTRVLRGIIDRTRSLSPAGPGDGQPRLLPPVPRRARTARHGAGPGGPGHRPDDGRANESLVLPVATLREYGVRVGLGSDGVRDSWSPFGNADMLHRAHILGWVTDVRLDDELSACYDVGAHGGADVMGLPRADLRPGAPADFVLVRGECLPQVLVDMPRRDLVVHGGRVVARDGELV